MKVDTANARYRQRYLEPDLPAPPEIAKPWQHVIVIPAYRERPTMLDSLLELSGTSEPFLAIIVLNRPDRDEDRQANAELAAAIMRLPLLHGTSQLYRLSEDSAVLLHNSESTRGPLPSDKGVGLGRKIGCDIAWQWIDAGVIDSRWIHSSDADARLPADYFQRTSACDSDVVAVTFPFVHVAGNDRACNRATALYELHLHHYVLGLTYAGSPYAHHSLGSCLAMTANSYAKVRGFPPRAGGEDFYLLNKLAKVGAIKPLPGRCIELESRHSHRVPFGTGPAVARISSAGLSPTQFYHPLGFHALRNVLHSVEAYAREPGASATIGLLTDGLTAELTEFCEQALVAMGWQSCIEHCLKHSDNPAQFMRHFHQWFDAFRTLKFLHRLRDSALPLQSLEALESLWPNLWPVPGEGEELADAIRSQWDWTRQGPRR